MDNDDKFYIEFHWTTLKDSTSPETMKGNWAFTGVTGKLKGITGKGTYTATENENGGEANMEGEYSVLGTNNTADRNRDSSVRTRKSLCRLFS